MHYKSDAKMRDLLKSKKAKTRNLSELSKIEKAFKKAYCDA
ncbi:MAG: hypothetical protein ACJAWS_002639 [Oleiphilaceae bacterium]|jgi:hypothetical protein